MICLSVIFVLLSCCQCFQFYGLSLPYDARYYDECVKTGSCIGPSDYYKRKLRRFKRSAADMYFEISHGNNYGFNFTVDELMNFDPIPRQSVSLSGQHKVQIFVVDRMTLFNTHDRLTENFYQYGLCELKCLGRNQYSTVQYDVSPDEKQATLKICPKSGIDGFFSGMQPEKQRASALHPGLMFLVKPVHMNDSSSLPLFLFNVDSIKRRFWKEKSWKVYVSNVPDTRQLNWRMQNLLAVQDIMKPNDKRRLLRKLSIGQYETLLTALDEHEASLNGLMNDLFVYLSELFYHLAEVRQQARDQRILIRRLLNMKQVEMAADQHLLPARVSDISEDEFCPICRGEFNTENSAAVVKLRECRHMYHKKCIKPWIQRNAVCPLCRTAIQLIPAHGSKLQQS